MHHQFLYLSRLVDTCSFDVFAAICKRSRIANAQRLVRGVLLFDGYRFCQLLDGPTDDTLALMERIGRDQRHEQIDVLVDRQVSGAASSAAWSAGYCAPDELDRLELPARQVGDRAIEIFNDIVTRADLAP